MSPIKEAVSKYLRTGETVVDFSADNYNNPKAIKIALEYGPPDNRKVRVVPHPIDSSSRAEFMEWFRDASCWWIRHKTEPIAAADS